MRCVAKADTGFQRLEVWSSGRETEFRVAGAIHAWWHLHRFLTGLAWDNIAAAALLRPAGPPRKILMLGLAGGTSLRVLRHLIPEAEFTAVEIDPGIVSLAQEHMALDHLGIDIHIADAYEWLKTNRERFDVVIDDVYRGSEDDVERPGAWSTQLGKRLEQTLRPGGLLIANLVIGAGHRRMQSAFRKHFLTHFSCVRSITTPDSVNEVLVGGHDVLPGKALTPWRPYFSTALDRDYWDRLRVKKLNRRSRA